MANTEGIPTSDDPEVVKPGGSSKFYDTAKRAYASGLEGAQVRLKQAGGVVREGAQKASETSKDVYTKVAGRVDEYTGKVHKKAVDYHGNISRALAAPRSGEDSEGEPVRFPLSILTWCSSLCGSKKSRAREMAPEPAGVDEEERAESPDLGAPHHHHDDAANAAPA